MRNAPPILPSRRVSARGKKCRRSRNVSREPRGPSTGASLRAKERSGYPRVRRSLRLPRDGATFPFLPKFLAFSSPQRGDWRRRVDREFRLTCLCKRSSAKRNLSEVRPGPAPSNIPNLRRSRASEKGEQREPFRESTRTEHRSETQCSGGRSAYMLLCEVGRLTQILKIIY